MPFPIAILTNYEIPIKNVGKSKIFFGDKNTDLYFILLRMLISF